MSDIVADLLNQTRSDDDMSLKTVYLLRDAADEIELLRKQLVKANSLLRVMLDDPDPNLDEPDTDGEVILKFRRMIQAHLDEGLPTTNDVRGILTLTDEKRWPLDCHDPGSCSRHLSCMYVQCPRHERDGNEVAKEIHEATQSSGQ